MPELIDPNRGLSYGWDEGEDGWKNGMDKNLTRLGAFVGLEVLSASVSTPPGSPAEGDRYIVGPSPTGAWTGQENAVAVFLESTWTFHDPGTAGLRAYIDDEAVLAMWDGSAWDRGEGTGTELALLYGAPGSFTLDTGLSVVTNWGSGGSNSPAMTVDAVAGTITFNEAGTYQIDMSELGDQGNAARDQEMYLYVRSSIGGDTLLWSFSIVGNKIGTERPLARRFVATVAAGEVLSMVLSATASLGTFTFINAQFAAERVRL